MKWFLLIHQIPAKPTYFRAKIWRRLHHIGAVAIKQAVYVLPHNESSNEAFRWIAKEIIESGGEAVVTESAFVEGLTDNRVVELFQKARKDDYEKILQEAEAVVGLWNSPDREDSISIECKANLTRLRKAFKDVKDIDFYPGEALSEVETYLADMEEMFRKSESTPTAFTNKKIENVKNKIWVTQTNIYVDRMASAWFIQRFIDEGAEFKFVETTRYKPLKDEIRYDMMEAEYTHENDLCTFEVLVKSFARADKALIEIAKIIHDIDLKDNAFGLVETAGVKALFDGIYCAESDDIKRIDRAGFMLDELLAYFRL